MSRQLSTKLVNGGKGLIGLDSVKILGSVPTAPTAPPPPPPQNVAPTHGTQLRAPLLDKSNQTQYRNGYTVALKEPSYTPYRLPTAGRKHHPAFAIAPRESLPAIDPLSPNDWDLLARRVGLIHDNGHLRPLQIECSNIIVSGGGDVCVIGPTGCGKSLLWVLPLHAMGGGISLVITPYTSLGREAENNNHGKGVSSIFLCSEQNSAADFALSANGDMMVIYACIEMIESPSFARLLHADEWVFEESLKAHIKANPLKKKGKPKAGKQMPDWQKIIARSVEEMDKYTLEELAGEEPDSDHESHENQLDSLSSLGSASTGPN
ncbi:hypothetical protein B0H14DRAFT_3566779 [Mycena olivaceomarginata]|nr:hypothetical protein B0H14DRAFT_3566779 [Mycena olivaceomarginata]